MHSLFSLFAFAFCIADAGKHYLRHSPVVVANNSLVLYTQSNYTGTQVCSSAGALAKNFVATISNDAPAQGEQVTTTFDFDLDAPIVGGTAYYSATLNGLGPFTSSAPLCDETAKTGDPCPLGVGHHRQESTTKNSVTGKVVTRITWEDPAGSEILCVVLTTKST